MLDETLTRVGGLGDIVERHPAATRAADALVVDRVDSDAVEPRREARIRTEPGKRAPGTDQRLLDGVLGIRARPKLARRQREQPRVVALHELGEGALVSAPCPRDEWGVPVHLDNHY